MKIDISKKIIKKINSKKAKISVIGLGYVGLPLCLALAKAKFKVFGIDNNVERIQLLKDGISYISTIKNSQIRNLDYKKFIPTNDFKEILNSDVIIICVPTPIDSRKKPNMKYVKNVVKQIDRHVKKFQTIIFECTSYPGTTEEFFLPILKKKKFNVGKNIFLRYSPEREDPGNKNYSILKNNLSKVVSGYSVSCRNIVKAIYEQVSNEVYLCNDIKTAEFTKLLENIYRSVNIGLINELHSVCKKMDINIFDAIKAAKTKPFGFNSFYPGPGVGGHCIPVDPYFLTYKAKQLGVNTKFIKLAGKINDNRPNEISKEILNYIKKNKLKKNILIMGITYKKNSDDLRESPVLKVYNLLNKKMKNKVFVCDPMLSNLNKKSLKNIKFINLKELNNKSIYKKFDLCFVGSNHDVFNYKKISKNFKAVFDSRDSFDGLENNIRII